jgi:hypothetical protein
MDTHQQETYHLTKYPPKTLYYDHYDNQKSPVKKKSSFTFIKPFQKGESVGEAET